MTTTTQPTAGTLLGTDTRVTISPASGICSQCHRAPAAHLIDGAVLTCTACLLLDVQPDEVPASAYALAALAGCVAPLSPTSPGALFLLAVAEHAAERREDQDEDTAHEVADSAVPVYTWDLWTTFTDLGAWEQDTEEQVCLSASADLTARATAALYVIAFNLAGAVLAGQE